GERSRRQALTARFQCFVPEALPQLIYLLPDFRLGFEKIDEMAGGDAERRRGFADARLGRFENVEDQADDGPEAFILAADFELARKRTHRGELRALGNGAQPLGADDFTQFKIERLPQPFQRLDAIFVLRAALLGDDDERARQMADAHRRA